MRDIKHCYAESVVYRPDCASDALPQRRIECGKRFIEKKYLRLCGKCPCKLYPLCLSSRERCDGALLIAFKPDQLEKIQGESVFICFLLSLHPEFDVLQHVHRREKREVLEHHANIPVLYPCVRYILTIENDRTAVWILKACDDGEKR